MVSRLRLLARHAPRQLALVTALLAVGCPLAVDDRYVLDDDRDSGAHASGGAAGAAGGGSGGSAGSAAAGAAGTSTVDSGTPAPAPRCDDLQRNGSETDVDCGGPSCPLRCQVGKVCGGPTDCATNTCTLNRCSAVPTCDDRLKNASETDVDCGGPICPRCRTGQTCNTERDCAGEEASCTSGRCSSED
jgi:hypothetical protein